MKNTLNSVHTFSDGTTEVEFTCGPFPYADCVEIMMWTARQPNMMVRKGEARYASLGDTAETEHELDVTCSVDAYEQFCTLWVK